MAIWNLTPCCCVFFFCWIPQKNSHLTFETMASCTVGHSIQIFRGTNCGLFFDPHYEATKLYVSRQRCSHHNLTYQMWGFTRNIFTHQTWNQPEWSRQIRTRCLPLLVTVKHKLSDSIQHLRSKWQFIFWCLLVRVTAQSAPTCCCQ